MDRETIEKAALEHALNTTGLDYIGEVACENGFIAGARWMIKSAWHGNYERPAKGRHIIVRTGGGSFTSWFVTDDIMDVFDRFSVTLWAYVDDLVPDGKPTESAENFPQNSADFPRKFRECRKTSSSRKEVEE